MPAHLGPRLSPHLPSPLGAPKTPVLASRAKLFLATRLSPSFPPPPPYPTLPMTIAPIITRFIPPYLPKKESYVPTHPELFLIHFGSEHDFSSSLVTQRVSCALSLSGARCGETCRRRDSEEAVGPISGPMTLGKWRL